MSRGVEHAWANSALSMHPIESPADFVFAVLTSASGTARGGAHARHLRGSLRHLSAISSPMPLIELSQTGLDCNAGVSDCAWGAFSSKRWAGVDRRKRSVTTASSNCQKPLLAPRTVQRIKMSFRYIMIIIAIEMAEIYVLHYDFTHHVSHSQADHHLHSFYRCKLVAVDLQASAVPSAVVGRRVRRVLNVIAHPPQSTPSYSRVLC